MNARIIASCMREDQRTTGTSAEAVLASARDAGLRVRELSIQPLPAGWEAEPPGTFKSGAGPLFALEVAVRLLGVDVDVVRIHGRDDLRAMSSADRQQMMSIYGDVSIPQGYTHVAEHFLELHGLSEADFARLARALEANMRKTAALRGIEVAPPGTHGGMVTRLFRMVDCANPVIDFEGELVVATDEAARELDVGGAQVQHVSTTEVADGPAAVEQIAGYAHLRRLIDASGVTKLRPDDVSLELYTCFPVVPLAFLWCAGWANTVDDALALLTRVPVTLSGGMNFARAPWNNPALRGLILAARAVAGGGTAVVHGNGGLGGRQGIAVLEG